MKTCPYCWEKIQKLAKKCRYCWERLEEAETVKTKTNVAKKSKHPVEETGILYDWFSFNWRLWLFNFYRIIFLYMAVSVVLVPIILAIPKIGQLLLAIISTCIMIYYLWWIINRRLKDRWMNLWNFIACLIPVIWRIYFIYVFINIFFLPWNKWDNKYWEEPQNVYLFFKKKWNLWLRVLATACILIIVWMWYTTTPIKHNINRVDYPLENTTEQQKENTTEQQKENNTEQQKENTTEQQKENISTNKMNTDDKDKWQLVYYPNWITGQEKYWPTFDKLEDCEHGALLSKEWWVDATCNKWCKKMNSWTLMCDKVVRTRWVENWETFYEDDKDMFDYECKSYKNLVYDKLNETFHFQWEPQLAMDEIIDSDIFVLHDYTIWYSPVTKSCIASMRITSYWKTSWWHTKNDILRIIDVTNDKVLFEDAWDTPEVHDKWKQEIWKYKIVNSN